jgi:nifR3 family TIM-barrel protein
MEDVSNIAFRRIAKRIGGPGLMFTEFVSAMAIHYGAMKTLKKMRIHPDERPLGIQIFGADPAIMADTARLAEDMGADIVDINMGCWVPKVCKTGSGAALLKDPDAAESIVRHVVNAVKVPVTVKVRAGWDYSLFAAPELARRFEAAGAQMLTLHARFAKQGFDGEANWELIQQLRDAVSIPLLGNGDVKTPEDAHRMMSTTGANGVMVGRACISNPWALRDIHRSMCSLPELTPPTLDERIETALEHARLFIAHEAGEFEWADVPPFQSSEYREAEQRAVRALRGQLPLYVKGAPGASQVRAQVTHCNTYTELEDILRAFAETSALLPA